MTYPLYLLHPSVRIFVYERVPDVRTGHWDIVIIAAILGLSLAVVLVMEPPIKRWVRLWLEKAVAIAWRPAGAVKEV